jgi:hypothetical protein
MDENARRGLERLLGLFDEEERLRLRKFLEDSGYATGEFNTEKRKQRPRPDTVEPDLRELRDAAISAHPDRGGTNEEFREAWERYERARRSAQAAAA